jgi:hypothetical protein
MKNTRSTYKKDKYYKVTAAVDRLLKESHVVAPVEVFMQMGNLTKEDYENWRLGRILYLERVIQGSLSKANRILHILRLHAQERGLYPSLTVYHKWGNGQKIRLRFSKSGNPAIEELYSTHYVARPDANKRDSNTHSEDTNGQDHLDNYDTTAVAIKSRTRKKP